MIDEEVFGDRDVCVYVVFILIELNKISKSQEDNPYRRSHEREVGLKLNKIFGFQEIKVFICLNNVFKFK